MQNARLPKPKESAASCQVGALAKSPGVKHTINIRLLHKTLLLPPILTGQPGPAFTRFTRGTSRTPGSAGR